MSNDTEHRTAVRYQPAWREWLAECKHGGRIHWIGSYLPTQQEAQAEARRHEEQAR